jgi:hypothetical protein
MRRTLSILGIAGLVVLSLVALKLATNSQLARAGGASDVRAADPAANEKPAAAGERNDRVAPAAGVRNARRTTEFLPRPSPEEERILAALATPVDVEFVDVALEDCLNFIGDYPKLPQFTMFLDRPTLVDEGVALDQPINLKVKGLRLESVLHLLLRPVQLEFLAHDDVLKITTSAKAGEIMFTRTYPVPDLYRGRPEAHAEPAKSDARDQPPQKVGFQGSIGEGQSAPEVKLAYQGFGAGQPAQKDQDKGAGTDPQKPKDAGPIPAVPRKPFTDLVEALTTTIEPDSWENMSGPGSYTYVSETRCLVIRQTWQIHREILQLLRDLREAKEFPPGGAK